MCIYLLHRIGDCMSDILSEMSDTQASPLTKDFKIDLPEDVSFIINTIEKNGHQAYAVGGCVRDTIMGVTPNDWDITTNALPEEVKSYFTKTIDTGIQQIGRASCRERV